MIKRLKESSVVIGIIAALVYLVYVFKGKADKANASALLAKTEGMDKILVEQQEAVHDQEAKVDADIAEIEARIKERESK